MTWLPWRRPETKPELKSSFSIIIFENKDTRWWSAQCIEYDIAAQAKTFSELSDELRRVIDGHIFVSRKLGLEPFAALPPAPESYRRAFDNLSRREVPKRHVPEMRIAAFSLAH